LKSNSKTKKGNSQPSLSSKTIRQSQIRKPVAKQTKFPNTNKKIRGKTEKDGKSRK